MKADVQPPALISIGIGSGGISRQNKEVHDALSEIQRMVIRERGPFRNEGLRLNIVFHIPGPIFQPDYVGVHATRFDHKNAHLLVVAAVPPDLALDDVSTYAAKVLRAASLEARAYIAKRGLQVPLDAAQALIDHLIVQLRSA